MNLVIVESPAKAKTINKYLGDDYKVLASYGHIRDLPSKNGSVDPDQDFKMEWEVDSFSKKYLKEITDAAKDSSKIILATDPDREGEAIAWHVKEYLNEKKLLKDKEIERVVFNEITKKAVIHGIENPRQIEPLLVDAYMARRALDYLVGFNISPILWTKLPGSKSAGRVQSVALKLITEREHQIESFKPDMTPQLKEDIQFSKPLEFYYLRTVGANLMEFGKTYFIFIKNIEIIHQMNHIIVRIHTIRIHNYKTEHTQCNKFLQDPNCPDKKIC